jgi:hypothetical protein
MPLALMSYMDPHLNHHATDNSNLMLSIMTAMTTLCAGTEAHS